MLNYNKCILCGVVCNTPSLRHNESGTSVTNFTLKTIEKWRDRKSGEFKKYSKYHKIVVWGKNAEKAVKFVRKDVIVLVEGCLNYHKYPKNGNDKNIAEIKAESIEYRGKLRKRDDNKRHFPAKKLTDNMPPVDPVENLLNKESKVAEELPV